MIYKKCYAKVNITFDILEKNENLNMHKINSIMFPIDLYDEIYISDANDFVFESNISIENNLVIKAIDLFCLKYNKEKKFKVKLKKNIPIGAGLAGGSTDASGIILALDEYFKLNNEKKEYEDILKQIGSDCLFTLYSKPAIVSGYGDEIEFINIKKRFNLYLILPNIQISTKESYRNVSKYSIKRNLKKIVDNINSGYVLKKDITNDLLYPSLKCSLEYKNFYDSIKNKYNIFQSGSGSTFFSFKKIDDKNLKILKIKILN